MERNYNLLEAIPDELYSKWVEVLNGKINSTVQEVSDNVEQSIKDINENIKLDAEIKTEIKVKKPRGRKPKQ